LTSIICSLAREKQSGDGSLTLRKSVGTSTINR
jgi:hypothetical protein